MRPEGTFWLTAFKIAWRELRASPAKFAFVMLAVAAGVASLTGVRGFSGAFHTMLASKARALMAADVSVREFSLPSAQQEATLAGLERRGARLTRVTETLTMIVSAARPVPVMISAKAIDPSVYPFYGTVKLDPPAPLASVLNDRTIAVGDDVLARLNARVGDMVRLGGQEFRIAAVVVSEPDRMSGNINVGLRVLMTRGGLDRTGLIRFGSRAAQRLLFQLPAAGLTVDEAKATLHMAFPEAQVIGYRETNPSLTRGLDRATTFLSLICLIALIVGAIGVASAIEAHLRQKMDTIAVMKSMGARSAQVIRIYTIEALILGGGGSLVGIVAGTGIERVFPLLLRRYFQLPVAFVWDWRAAAQGVACGLLTTLLFTVPPLLRIRRIRPNVILRRDMPEALEPWRKRWRQSRESAVWALAILSGLGALAAWLGGSPRVGAYFAGGLAASLLALSAVSWVLLRAVKLLLRRVGLRLPSSMRQGLANLYRPGNQAQSVLVALGVGVMFTLSIYLVQKSLIAEIVETAPPGLPNVFLIDVQPGERDGLVQLIRSCLGANTAVDIVPSIQARITRVNGVPVEDLGLQGFARRFVRTRAMTTAAAQPDGLRILAGQWWRDGGTGLEIAAAEEAAKILHLKPGATIEIEGMGRRTQVRVAAVYRSEGFRMSGMSEFIATPAALAGLPAIHYGGVHVDPRRVASLEQAVYAKYPTVTVVNIAEALALVQEVVDQIALVIRFLSAFAIVGGVIILASSVAGTRLRRVHEVVILKTLGGTRRRIARAFSIEFAVIGSVAGLMGGLLAAGFSTLVLRRLLDGHGNVDWSPILVAVAATALVAIGAGWLASFRILAQKPLEILREE